MLQPKTLIRLLWMPALSMLSLFGASVYGQKSKTQTVAFTPPTLSVAADPIVVTTCTGDTASAIVRLSADGTATQGAALYKWHSTGGTIQGNAATATWDLAGLAPGYYVAFLDVKSGSDNEACEAFSSTTVLVNCLPAPPVCPNVLIICPQSVTSDEPITFTANIAGGTGNVAASYSWSVSAGQIIAGQGTPSITVDTKGVAGQSITAQFSVNGYPQDCSASCIVQVPMPKRNCKKFDEFPSIQRNDEKARLDNFAVELQSDPTSTGYVVVSPAANGRPEDLKKHTSRIADYLVNTRGLDAARIVTVTGSPRSGLMVELWTCPQGSTIPKPDR